MIVPNPRQPRSHFKEGAVRDLAASIKEVGVLQPLVVRPLDENRYELIAGERRLRASKLAGLARVPVVVREADEQNSLELALIENVQREDISPLESARAFRQLIDEFGMTQERVADRVGKSRVAVANTVRLLRLPARILQALEDGTISEAHARTLLGFADPIEQLAIFNEILEKGLTVKDVERLASKTPAGRKKPRGSKSRDPNWESVAENLATTLGAPVKLEQLGQGGRLVIDFYSDEDLERIADAIMAQ